MGFFDDVSCQHALPDGRDVAGGRFQTKMLGRGLMQYAITAEGRLVLQLFRDEPAEGQGPLGRPASRRVHTGDLDTEFHGDIYLCGHDTQGEFVEYVARFTHGALESLTPLAELDDARRAMIATLQDGW